MKNMLMLEISLGFHFFKSSFPSCVNWPHYFKDSHRSTFPPTHPWAFFFFSFIYLFSLPYCIGFAKHWHESAMGVHVLPSWTPLPPPSPFQCTSPEQPVSCIEPGLAIHFTYDTLHISMPFSHIIPPAPSPSVQKTVLYICVSFAVSHTGLSLPSF